jgi:hypothetical protein
MGVRNAKERAMNTCYRTTVRPFVPMFRNEVSHVKIVMIVFHEPITRFEEVNISVNYHVIMLSVWAHDRG